MHKLIVTAIATLFAATAYAQAPAAAPTKAEAPKASAAEAAKPAASDCEAKAVGKDGKPLAGAAKNAFMKKCEKDAAAKK